MKYGFVKVAAATPKIRAAYKPKTEENDGEEEADGE